MRGKAVHVYLALAMFGPTALLSGQSSWPAFRGPTGQGHAESAPKSWGINQGVAWKAPTKAHGWSSPVIQNDTIVMTGQTGSGDDTRLHVFALNASTGKPIWTRELFAPTRDERQAKHAKNTLASSTPLIREGIVYAHFGHMGTAALKLDSGKTVWTSKIRYRPKHGGASSLLFADSHLVFSADGESDPKLVALHADTGKIAWEKQRDAKVKRSFSFSTPLLVEVNDQAQIISPASGMVAAYAPKDGKVIWKAAYDEGFSIVPRPVVMDDTVFLSTGFMKPRLLAIDLKGASGDITDSHVRWTAKRFAPKTPSFIADNGVLYVLDDTGSLSCFDAKTGDSRWREKLIGNFSASPILADGHLYCTTEDGVCYVVKVSPDDAEVTLELDLEQRVLASPAVVDGVLYLRTETHLWKITG